MEVVVYSNKNCMQCEQTKKHLEKNGVPFTVVDMNVDTEALERMKALGYRQAPIVMAGDDVWVGFNLAKIKAVANAIAK